MLKASCKSGVYEFPGCRSASAVQILRPPLYDREFRKDAIMRKYQTQTYGLLSAAVFLLALMGTGCSHSQIQPQPPYDSVAVDRSNPDQTVIVLNGKCADEAGKNHDQCVEKKSNSVTRDGKTYYFDSAADRDRFIETYSANSRY